MFLKVLFLVLFSLFSTLIVCLIFLSLLLLNYFFYADDILLSIPCNSASDISLIQHNIDHISSAKYLTVNSSKTKYVFISLKPSSFFSSFPPLYLNSSSLELVYSYKYLGVPIFPCPYILILSVVNLGKFDVFASIVFTATLPHLPFSNFIPLLFGLTLNIVQSCGIHPLLLLPTLLRRYIVCFDTIGLSPKKLLPDEKLLS